MDVHVPGEAIEQVVAALLGDGEWGVEIPLQGLQEEFRGGLIQVRMEQGRVRKELAVLEVEERAGDCLLDVW